MAVTGFTITIKVTTDEIEDIVAYGRLLRVAEDGDRYAVNTLQDAATEVAYVFATFGVDKLIERGGVYVELRDVVGEVVAP